MKLTTQTQLFESLAQDIRDRAEVGRNEYGDYLRHDSTDNPLLHTYEELLDAIQYYRQAIVSADDFGKPIYELVIEDLQGAMTSDPLYLSLAIALTQIRARMDA
jgi:hypothetical protein